MSQLAAFTRLRVNVVDFRAEVRLSIECTYPMCALDDRIGRTHRAQSRFALQSRYAPDELESAPSKALLAADERR
jgi:hypothetical protein